MKVFGKIKIGLVQINNSFSNQNYLPLSVGMLQAYVQKYISCPDKIEFLMPIYSRTQVETAVKNLLEAQVVFVSVYVWNMRISLEIAKALKNKKPEVLIIFGGPHVPNKDDEFLKKHPFIDLACHGEGEQVALSILENFWTENWGNVPSVSFINKEGHLVRTNQIPRAKDLAVYPSPYLEGVFEPLIEANPNENWIGLWETNRGCPFACTFCDWGSAVASKVYSFDFERLCGEIEWFAKKKIEFIFCCDANFGILRRDIDIATYVAETKSRLGYPKALSVQATKNATERAYETQKILAESGLNKGVDIALQSIDPDTLKSIKRSNISTETYQELQRRFTRDGVETFTDLILGLPGETYDSFAKAVSKIIENGQHNRIQFNNLSILPNAEMGDPAYQKKYGMETVETRTINIHGSLLEDDDEIYETQSLVIGTNSMPLQEWVRVRAFSWMAALLHFDKVLQIPFVILHEICSVSYRELIELFFELECDTYPVLSSVKKYFLEKARDIQNAGPEFCQSQEWLNIWWPADEYILIKLSFEGNLENFYSEAELALKAYLDDKSLGLPSGLLNDAIKLNKSLLKLPFQTENLEVDVSYNIFEYYHSVKSGVPDLLTQEPKKYHIDRTSMVWNSWDDWCREVIWYGNKKGAYLYGNSAIEPQLSGHF
ncbi:MAG: radical SAM protein [Nitrospirota bacterium]|nr:radical SAM protein [Nitrospirota bacterium]